MRLAPQPGPQTLFASSKAHTCIFASSPGAGKSYAGVLESLRWTHLPNYTGVLLRENRKELIRGPTSLYGLASSIGAKMGGRPRQAPYPGVEFGGGTSSVLCMHGNVPKTEFDGLEVALSFWDELDHFQWDMYQYVTGSRSRTTCGIKPYVRASVMPSNGTWVRDLVGPWLNVVSDEEAYPKPEESGRIRWYYYDARGVPQIFDEYNDALESASAVDKSLKPRSLAFVFASTLDNKVLMQANPEYLDNLSQLTGYERSRLLYQNWNARPSSAGMFDRSKWRVADRPPLPKDIVASVRGWDLAASLPSDDYPDPDWTRGARLDMDREGVVWVTDMVSARDRPGPIDELIQATARLDGPRVFQAFSRDPGSAGVRDEQHIRDILSKVPGCGQVKVQPAANKVALAKVWSAVLSQGKLGLVRAHWNAQFLGELDKFPSSRKQDHDDQVDAVSYAWRELPVNIPQSSFAQMLLNNL